MLNLRPLQWFPNLRYYFTLFVFCVFCNLCSFVSFISCLFLFCNIHPSFFRFKSHFQQTAELFICHIHQFLLFLFHSCVFVCLSHLFVFISCSSSLIFSLPPSLSSNPISSKLSQLLIFGFSWMIKCFQNICTSQGATADFQLT